MAMENRAIWLAIMMLAAALAGAAGGLLSWRGGMSPENAVLTGAGAFGTTLFLMIAIWRFLANKPE